MKNKIENNLCKFAPQMYSVLKELQESASYWSEYDVPLGIVERINDVLKKVESNKKTDDYNKLVELLKEAAKLVGHPCTNISSSTDIACDNWQEKFKVEIEKQNIQ